MTDLLSGSRVVDGENLPTNRVLPLVVDENLQKLQDKTNPVYFCTAEFI